MEAEPAEAGAARSSSGDLDIIGEAIGELASEYGVSAILDDRVIRLTDPVTGNPHLAALQALGLAAKAAPVGAAAHGPTAVAAAVWQGPELFIARWTGVSRWVALYKFSSRGRPDDYLREDAGIPSHLSKGNWYGEVPDEVAEAFLAVGLLLDEPPFPVPVAPAPAPEPPAPERAARAPRAAAPKKPPAPRAPRKKATAPAPKKAVPATRTCASCNLQKHLTQFEPDSDLCVDCR